MEALMDQIWLYLVSAIGFVSQCLDFAIAPVNRIGPGWAIVLLAAVTAGLTKVLARIYRPKRYRELQRNFEYWYKIRQEALQQDDVEKGRLLAKNIDQTHLNKAYYDLFFEGLLISLLTRYLPIFSMLAYVNEAYRPEKLQTIWNRPAVFTIKLSQEMHIAVGGVFWFLICLVSVYVLIWAAGRTLGRSSSLADTSSLMVNTPSTVQQQQGPFIP